MSPFDGELRETGLVAFDAQSMILRQERAIDSRNGVGDCLIHAGPLLRSQSGCGTGPM
jgi:hypothetical protein